MNTSQKKLAEALFQLHKDGALRKQGATIGAIAFVCDLHRSSSRRVLSLPAFVWLYRLGLRHLGENDPLVTGLKSGKHLGDLPPAELSRRHRETFQHAARSQ